jgi:hypothetical protein
VSDIRILLALHQQRGRLTAAKAEFSKGGDIAGVLDPEEFSEVRAAANMAAENKMNAMLESVTARLEGIEG